VDFRYDLIEWLISRSNLYQACQTLWGGGHKSFFLTLAGHDPAELRVFSERVFPKCIIPNMFFTK